MVYKFNILTTKHKIDTCWLQSKNKGQRNYALKKWLTSYDLDYKIPEREKTELYKKGNTWIKKFDKIDWRCTIYNLKLIKLKNSHLFKVTFKIKLSPREAYTIGKAISEMDYTYNVTYEKVLKKANFE